MILQRDLANPQHLLGSRSSSHNQFNSLSRSARSRSYLSISGPHLPPPSKPEPENEQPSTAAAGTLGTTKRKRHSVHHYGSQSQLMPEYHANPYLGGMNISPHRHKTPQPPTNPYATLSRSDYPVGGGRGVLSQPETMYEQDEGGRGGGMVGDPGGGFFSYGTATVVTSSRRRRGPKPNKRAREPAEETAYGALSQPSDETKFYTGGRGGGSMRNPAPMYPAVGWSGGRGRFDGRTSLTQYAEEGEEEAGQWEGDRMIQFSRTASRQMGGGGGGAGSGNGYPPPQALVAAMPHHENSRQKPTIVVSEANGSPAAAAEDDRPLEWEVRILTHFYYYLLNVNFNIFASFQTLTLQEQKRQKVGGHQK